MLDKIYSNPDFHTIVFVVVTIGILFLFLWNMQKKNILEGLQVSEKDIETCYEQKADLNIMKQQRDNILNDIDIIKNDLKETKNILKQDEKDIDDLLKSAENKVNETGAGNAVK